MQDPHDPAGHELTAVASGGEGVAERLLEAMRAIVLVVDARGHIVRCNSHVEAVTGYRIEELRGLDWITALVPERDRPRVSRAFAGVREGREVAGDVYPLVSRDGQVRLIEWYAQLLAGPSGQQAVLCLGHDVTGRERLQGWLHSLVEAAQDAVLMIDREGRIVSFNRAAEQMFGYRREEIRGRKVNLLMPEPYAREHDGYIRRYEQTGEAQAIGRLRTVVAQRKSGETFPIELSVAEVERGGEISYGAFIRDVSERARIRQQLIDNERLAAIGTTAAKLAHEIGNPINGMRLKTQMLQRRLQRHAVPDERMHGDVDALLRGLDHLKRLLEEFRALSRKQRYRMEPTDLTGIVDDVLRGETALHEARNILIERELAVPSPIVRADPGRLHQALLNLCKNAAEAMQDGGTLRIRVSCSEGTARVEVTDTGPGIPEGVDVFEPFETTKDEGTGLGLPITRQILEAHGGSITYATGGDGTTFSFELPLHDGPGSPA